MIRLTVRGWLYSLLAVVAPFTALGLGDPSPALVALPPAVLVVFGLVARPREMPRMEVALDAARALEGTPVEVELTVQGGGRRAHVQLDLARHVQVVEARGARRVGEVGLVVPLRAGRGRAVVTFVARRWGSYRLGDARVTVRGPAGIVAAEIVPGSGEPLTVLPETETVRRLVEPYATNLHAGDMTSRTRGPGSELAELRPWAAGDSSRSLNWRASARSERLWVTDRHAERNGDLILLIDSVAPPGTRMEGAVADSVRIAASLIRAYGAGRHRLGLVSLSGYSRWFGLDSGRLHEHRLLAAAMATQTVAEPVWMAVDRILDRVVRPPSMVVVVSPLLDVELVGRVLRLGRAGIDVVAMAVDPTAWMPPPVDRTQHVARRIFHLERGRTLDRLRAAGVAVGQWDPARPLDEVLEEVERWRRRARRARL
ncbi:MAG: DUF58 domain-containing protein [Actinomycetota bacterium]